MDAQTRRDQLAENVERAETELVLLERTVARLRLSIAGTRGAVVAYDEVIAEEKRAAAEKVATEKAATT